MQRIRNILFIYVLPFSCSIALSNNIIAPKQSINLKSIEYASHIPPKHVFKIIDIKLIIKIIFINPEKDLSLLTFKILFANKYTNNIGIAISPTNLFS